MVTKVYVETGPASKVSVYTAGEMDRQIASKADVDQTMYIGTTAHAINRASAAEGLAGITSLTPGTNFTLSQNSVNVLTSENTDAIANTLYLKAGNIGIGATAPVSKLTITGGNFITPSADSTSAIGFASNASPTTPMLNIDTTNGRIGIGTTTPSGKLDIHNISDNVGLQVQGFSTQTNNLQEWKDSTTAILSHINGNGTLDIGIATGTAPLVVASTTVVNNLNTDLLDGQHGAYYAPLASPVFTTSIRLKEYTVATLPAGTQGDYAYVTDALLPAFLATVAGGGTVVSPVFYNGSSWVTM